MRASPKRPVPANDLPDSVAQKIPYAVLRKPFLNARKITSAALLIVLLALTGVAAFVAMPDSNKQAVIIQPAQKPAPVQTMPEPYDITINASELQPPQAVEAASGAIPSITIRPLGSGQHQLAPILEITVEDDNADNIEYEDGAAAKAALARKLAAQGNIHDALRAERRAVELEPDNVVYRLALAVLYDRSDDKRGAATLYEQVVQSCDEDGDGIPGNVDMTGVRQRLNYLKSMGY